jgi:hypothetical protein
VKYKEESQKIGEWRIDWSFVNKFIDEALWFDHICDPKPDLRLQVIRYNNILVCRWCRKKMEKGLIKWVRLQKKLNSIENGQ